MAVIKRKLSIETAARPAAAAPSDGPAPMIKRGNATAPILVVCEPNTVAGYTAANPAPMDFKSLQRVATAALKFGLTRDDFEFVSLCPPISESDADSASRKWKHVERHSGEVVKYIEQRDPKCIITLGELASRVVMNRAVAITKARGKALRLDVGSKKRTVMPMLSPAFVGRIPDHAPTFEADMLVLAKLKQADWVMTEDNSVEYEWCTDLQHLIDNPPKLIAIDTETTGLRWWQQDVRVLTVQITYRAGHALVIPVHRGYWPELSGRQMKRLRDQVAAICANPFVRKVGHNIKYDDRMLAKEGMPVHGWLHDTQLMAFAVDENMMDFGLDTCVRRWVPAMAGYSDEFDKLVDKSNMIAVARNTEYDADGRMVVPGMLEYAGGDTDATYRLALALDQALASDARQRNCYERMMMQGIMAFARNIEQFGILIDKDHLRNFGNEIRAWLADTYRELIQDVPAAVRHKHLEKGLEFSRGDFVKDILFSADGFGLKPQVYTKSTKNLPPDQREPSTSAKDHLPYFTDHPRHGAWVEKFIDYQKINKLSGTYVGEEAKGSGFWQYIAPNGRIYPSYMLHRTVTGRTASADPNGQNFPKRGRLAKAYLQIFRATPGFKIVSADLSQIELRIAAWMAMDRAMLQVYREGGDIHTATAKYVSQLSDEQWDALSKAERKLKRTQAKAVNFGFLYGMGWAKFMTYAKTDYGVTYTEREAQTARERFFRLYSALPDWHDRMRNFAEQNGYVRALHGAVRHLPSIKSMDKMIRSGAQRQAINSPVQRFGSDLGLMAVIRFAQQADPNLFRVIGFVHDAVLVEAREGFEQQCMSALVWCMENQPLDEWFGITPPLPIKAEADIGINFGETLELADLPPVEKRPEWFNEMGFDTFEPAKPDWWDDNKEEEALSKFQIVQRLSDVGL